MLWEDDRFGFEELYFSTSPKNNIKFKKDFPAVEEAGSQVLPSIAVLNGTVYVAMMNKKNWDIDFTEGNSINDIYRFDKPIRVNDDLRVTGTTPHRLQSMMRKIKQNMLWALGYNTAAIPVAAAGLLNPIIAAAARAISSLSVVMNSALLKRFRFERIS